MRLMFQPHDRMERAFAYDDPELAMEQVICYGVNPNSYLHNSCEAGAHLTLDALLEVATPTQSFLEREVSNALINDDYEIYRTIIKHYPGAMKMLTHLPIALHKDERFAELIIHLSNEISESCLLTIGALNRAKLFSMILDKRHKVRAYETMWRDTLLRTIVENASVDCLHLIYDYPWIQPRQFHMKITFWTLQQMKREISKSINATDN